MSFFKDPKVLDPAGIFESYLNQPDPELDALKEREKNKPKYVSLPPEEQAKSKRRGAARRAGGRRGRSATTALTSTLG